MITIVLSSENYNDVTTSASLDDSLITITKKAKISEPINTYLFNSQEVSGDLTLRQLNIKDNSTIKIFLKNHCLRYELQSFVVESIDFFGHIDISQKKVAVVLPKKTKEIPIAPLPMYFQ